MKYADYMAKRSTLLGEAEKLLNDGNIEGYNAKEKEIKDLDESWEKFAKAQANMNALKDQKLDPMAAGLFEKNNKMDSEKNEPEDIYNTLEYRKAFMNFCKTGSMDSKYMNVDAYTSTSDVGAVIPTSIMTEVIQQMKQYGQLFSRATFRNVKGGVKIPILSLKPTATRITESTPSDRKKVTANTYVEFSYKGLECKVATSLIAETVSLPEFESTIIGVIAEAMIKQMEIEMIAGNGTTEFVGVTADSRVPAANVITLTSDEFIDWGSWKRKVFGAIPLAYRAGGLFVMASGTFEGYIDGMQDSNGQPIGRTNYGITDGPQERFGGKEVLLVEDDVVKPYDAASVDDVVAIFFKPSDFIVNSNMQMAMFRWLDHDTNQWVDKAILINDGKLADPNGVIIIKKGA